MRALRDFKYRDLGTGQVVQVRAGQDVDGDTLARHRCDPEKLERTRYVARDTHAVIVTSEPPKRKRGRPRKQA